MLRSSLTRHFISFRPSRFRRPQPLGGFFILTVPGVVTQPGNRRIIFRDTLGEEVSAMNSKNARKLRMFLKPAGVDGCLISRGAKNDSFYTSRRDRRGRMTAKKQYC